MQNTKNDTPIGVTSRSFSKNKVLCEQLGRYFSNITFNYTGRNLNETETLEFLGDREAAIIGLEKITESILGKLPRLKYISKYGVGLDNLDLQAMKKCNVGLGWTGGVNKRSVSELALLFMLGALRSIFSSTSNLKKSLWLNQGGQNLTGRKIGIIGCGHVGKDLVELLRPLQNEVVIHDILDLSDFCKDKNIKQISKEELIRTSEIISLHIPYSPETHGYISEKELNWMKPNALLINTARGNIVDENALEIFLRENPNFTACFDVFAQEPDANASLLKLDNFIGTPHIGGATDESILAMGQSAIHNLLTFTGKTISE